MIRQVEAVVIAASCMHKQEERHDQAGAAASQPNKQTR